MSDHTEDLAPLLLDLHAQIVGMRNVLHVLIETHPDPSCALSDGANMLKLDKLDDLLQKLTRVREAIL